MSRPATIPTLQFIHRRALAALLLLSTLVPATAVLAQPARAGAANDAAMQAAIAAAKAGQLSPTQADALRGDPRWPWPCIPWAAVAGCSPGSR